MDAERLLEGCHEEAREANVKHANSTCAGSYLGLVALLEHPSLHDAMQVQFIRSRTGLKNRRNKVVSLGKHAQ